MRWHYGGFALPEGTIRSAARLDATHDERGNLTQKKWVWTLKGELMATGQTATVAAMRALEAALDVPRQNLVLRTDTGAVAMALTNTGSVSGVMITGLSYPEGVDGFEFVSGKTFEFTAEATYGQVTAGGGTVQLLTFTESVETSGGGPVTGFMRPINAEPQAVQLYSHSVYEATQSGQATCLLGYWPAPPPVMGQPIERPRIGLTCDGRVFTTTWAYRFQSARPMAGLPTRI